MGKENRQGKNKKAADRLLNLRGDKTLKEVSEAIGITPQALGYYERGERTPTLENVISLSRYYGVTTDYLLGVSDIKSDIPAVKELSDYCGLSEEAIKYLHNLNTSADSVKMDGRILDTINSLIEYSFDEFKVDEPPLLLAIAMYLFWDSDQWDMYKLSKGDKDSSPAIWSKFDKEDILVMKDPETDFIIRMNSTLYTEALLKRVEKALIELAIELY